MPYALPLGQRHYAQLIHSSRQAPRTEPADTQEIKGKRRGGSGTAYRAGSYALVLGEWWSTAETARRLRHAREQGQLLANRDVDPERDSAWRELCAGEGWSGGEGWAPPWWHYRRYLALLLRIVTRIPVPGLGGPLVRADLYASRVYVARIEWWRPTGEHGRPVIVGWMPIPSFKRIVAALGGRDSEAGT